MLKFDIKKDREKLSDQEIQQQMNFDKFISGYTPTKMWLTKGIKFYSIVSAGIAVVGIAGYLTFSLLKKQSISHDAPFINPPVLSMDKSFETFACLNISDTALVYNTGSIVKIPASAFVDENGAEITGQVQINYREFHDPIDILFSGIPMDYDSANTHYELESAGMFEVTASQNGKPIYLKNEKKITVDLISHTNNANDYNIYYLDTTKKEWNYISENTSTNNTCFPVFEANNKTKNLKNSTNTSTQSLSEEPFKPMLPKKENLNNYNFIIDYKKEEFPELSAYKGIKFEPVEDKKKFHTSLAQKTWDDVMIKRENDNEHYTITFLSEKESHSIKVRPVVDDKNYSSALIDFEKKQKVYEAFLAEKNKKALAQKDSLYRINTIYQSIAQQSNLNERLDNFINNSFTNTSRDLLVYRTFSISKLGIWNSDKPQHFLGAGEKSSHIAQFFSSDNKPLKIKSVSIIKRNINSIVTLSSASFKHFPFSNTIDIIVGIDYNNEVFYLKDDDLKNMDASSETIEFKMKKTDGISKPEDLKALLKI